MGGQAFAKSGPGGTAILVPRMPTEVYRRVAAEIQSQLEPIFHQVSIPRDVPGKPDHGDIDFLVEGSLSQWTPHSIGKDIGAEYHVKHGNTLSYAVPYPGLPNAYVQVDVEVSPGNGSAEAVELYNWTWFMKAYSDLLQIVGVCHRSLGLTCNDKGLHLRVAEIEPYNKKKSLLFLTRDPSEAMTFYGFNVVKYWDGFADMDEIYEWVVDGCFFSRTIFEDRIEKNNDRARLRKRPMYSKFVDEWIPSHSSLGKDRKIWTRDEVLQEALTTFSKQEEYAQMMEEHNTREQEEALWRSIREKIPAENAALGLALKGLKRWVGFTDGQPYIMEVPLLEDQPLWSKAITSESELLEWVSEHWGEAKRLEKERAGAAKAAGKTNTGL
ncbi:hypothetical protein P154DRAFT_527734 [Amniculicola lignicola CBS 123094]|uniref:Uncharacterized protein n=1 Tax=Amniculicola lignicola CBS 123094 TaxID=1392246 RepID=A0A6A5VUJ6_9PLEO|nr:hypothetical protein P154DRAFT_527734 [Amniculicola lignicola CBS 123094]